MSSTDSYPVDQRGFTDSRGAATYLGVSVSKLAKDRHYGCGAEHTVIGRAVRYSYAALDAFASKHRRTCTRDSGKAA